MTILILSIYFFNDVIKRITIFGRKIAKIETVNWVKFKLPTSIMRPPTRFVIPMVRSGFIKKK